jgi:hypothetical protein
LPLNTDRLILASIWNVHERRSVWSEAVIPTKFRHVATPSQFSRRVLTVDSLVVVLCRRFEAIPSWSWRLNSLSTRRLPSLVNPNFWLLTTHHAALLTGLPGRVAKVPARRLAGGAACAPASFLIGNLES